MTGAVESKKVPILLLGQSEIITPNGNGTRLTKNK
jgi:hypothetical protein